MSAKNYLNNRDILKEIHKSKTTYCSFTDPKYQDYDIIVGDISEITTEKIQEGKILRAKRLSRAAHEHALETSGEKRKLEEFEIDANQILDDEVVFRVMTWDHIPKMEPKQAVQDEDDLIPTEYELDDIDITPAKYMKCNFPPFQHFVVTNGSPACVGKSHWKGGFEDGEWSTDHGKLTNKLALMYMKLVERYATRSNWRGYTYNDEMRSQALLQLSQIGLKFDESKSENPFSYYTAAVTNSFTRVFNIEKRNQNLRDDIMQMNNLTPSLTRQMESSGGSYHED